MRAIIVFIFLSVLQSIHSPELFSCPEFFCQRTPADTMNGEYFPYNGRIWRDIYSTVRDDQFLFSKDFLPGSIKFNGIVYNGLKARYDIFLDELQIITEAGNILQINKEMTNDFTLIYNSNKYRFVKLEFNDNPGLCGFADIRYEGKSSLFLKHKKEISKTAPGKSYENFLQSDFIYALIDSVPHRIRNKNDILRILGNRRKEVSDYLKLNRLKINVKKPETLVQVLKYYDSIER